MYGNIKNILANDFSDMSAEEFRITTAEGLLAFAEACKEGGLSGKTVYLDADIDMTDMGYVAPNSFNGTFDGRYHTITGLKVEGWTDANEEELRSLADREYQGYYDYYVGAFVQHNYGTICRLSLKDVSISAECAIFAEVKYDELYGDYVDACVIAETPHIGGICAQNDGIVSDCDVFGIVDIGGSDTPGYFELSAKAYDVFGNELKRSYDQQEYKEIWEIDWDCEATSKYPLDGDINDDGKFNVADVVLLQKWLLTVPDTHLNNWKAADLCTDNRLDVFDLCLMKRELLQKS